MVKKNSVGTINWANVLSILIIILQAVAAAFASPPVVKRLGKKGQPAISAKSDAA